MGRENKSFVFPSCMIRKHTNIRDGLGIHDSGEKVLFSAFPLFLALKVRSSLVTKEEGKRKEEKKE